MFNDLKFHTTEEKDIQKKLHAWFMELQIDAMGSLGIFWSILFPLWTEIAAQP